jgi:hypothetical protein
VLPKEVTEYFEEALRKGESEGWEFSGSGDIGYWFKDLVPGSRQFRQLEMRFKDYFGFNEIKVLPAHPKPTPFSFLFPLPTLSPYLLLFLS